MVASSRICRGALEGPVKKLAVIKINGKRQKSFQDLFTDICEKLCTKKVTFVAQRIMNKVSVYFSLIKYDSYMLIPDYNTNIHKTKFLFLVANIKFCKH